MLVEHDDRIMVAITFHYRHDRLQYLYQTVRTLALYPVREVAFHIFTNSPNAGEHATIQNLLSEVMEGSPSSQTHRNLYIHVVGGLSNPPHRTWAHKPLIKEFLSNNCDYFIYTEDDHEITWANFIYFREYREKLKSSGLFPGFQRTELNLKDMCVYSTDQFNVVKIKPRARYDVDEYRFVTMDNPYYGFFILDQEMAEEYITTRSFDIEASKEAHAWEVSERSAMALSFENVPKGFWVRAVVPITKADRIAPMACVRHLPNNYANNSEHPLAKIKMSEVIAND